MNRLYSQSLCPGGSSGKEPAGVVRDMGLIPGSGRSRGGGHGNPLQYFGESHEWRSLAGYKEHAHVFCLCDSVEKRWLKGQR